MEFYTIQKGSPEEREQVKRQLLGLDRLSVDLQERWSQLGYLHGRAVVITV